MTTPYGATQGGATPQLHLTKTPGQRIAPPHHEIRPVAPRSRRVVPPWCPPVAALLTTRAQGGNGS